MVSTVKTISRFEMLRMNSRRLDRDEGNKNEVNMYAVRFKF